MNKNNKQKVVLINDTTYDNHYGCDAVIKTIRQLVKKYNGVITSSVPFYINWEKSQYIQNKIKLSDIVIVNGEGSLHSGNMEWLVTVAEFAKKYNSKVFLINSIYQNNPDSYKKYLRLFDMITVRESLSQKELNKIGIASTVVPDLSFYIHKKPHAIKSTKKVYFSDSTVDSASKELATLKDFSEEIHIRYHQFIRVNFGISLANLIKSNALMNLKNLVWLKRRGRLILKNEKKFIEKINSSKIIITGRFHLICLAIKHQKAFVPYKTNTHKIKGLLIDVFGKSKTPMEIDKNSIDKIEKNYAFKNQKLMKKYTTEANKKIEELFREMLQQ